MDIVRAQGRIRKLCHRVQELATTERAILAQQVVDEALHRDPADGHLHQELGLTLHGIGELDRARDVLEAAQVLIPLKPEAELVLAEAHVKADEKDLAFSLLQNLGRRRDSSPGVLLRAASLMEKIGECRHAWAVCRRAIDDHPDDASAWFQLSYYMARLQFPFNQVEAVGRRAIRLEPDVVEYRTSLAELLRRFGRPQDGYDLVAHFELDQIDRVCCASCLERLRVLYESASDWRRVCLCSERLRQLNLSSDAGCCGDPGSDEE